MKIAAPGKVIASCKTVGCRWNRSANMGIKNGSHATHANHIHSRKRDERLAGTGEFGIIPVFCISVPLLRTIYTLLAYLFL
jgi:hypothetical protein